MELVPLAPKILYPLQCQNTVLEKINIMFVDLPGDKVWHRFPRKGMKPAVRSNIQPGCHEVQKMAETQEWNDIGTILPCGLPLWGRFVQYKENVFLFFCWKMFHTILEKIKTIVLSRNTVFFIDQPDMPFLKEWVHQFSKTKSGEFFKMKKRTVV